MHTHYDNLKVARNAPPAVIKAAYRALSQQYHPDKSEHPDAERIMKIINEAWAVLGDEEVRAEYDRKLTASEALARNGNRAEHPAPASAPRRDGEPATQRASQEGLNRQQSEMHARHQGRDTAEQSAQNGRGSHRDQEKPRTKNVVPKYVFVVAACLLFVLFILGTTGPEKTRIGAAQERSNVAPGSISTPTPESPTPETRLRELGEPPIIGSPPSGAQPRPVATTSPSQRTAGQEQIDREFQIIKELGIPPAKSADATTSK